MLPFAMFPVPLAQTPPTATDAWSIIQAAGVVGVLLVGLYLILSGRLATKAQLNDLKDQLAAAQEEIKFWRDLALRGTSLVEGHVKVTDEEMTARMEGLETTVRKQLTAIEKMLKAKGRDVG